MTDEKTGEKKARGEHDAEKKAAELTDDTDWDQALSEWENESFVPEVAKDVATDKPGTLAGASRPLYRPPPVQGRPPPAPPPAKPKAPVGPVGRVWPVEESETGVTRMARVPEELLREQLSKGGAAARGGLTQLFARDEPRAEKIDRPQPFDPGRTAPPPPLDSDGELSASTVPPAGTTDEEDEYDKGADAPGPVSLLLEASEEEEPTRAFTGGPDAAMASLPGPALLAPEARRFDPNDVTVVGSVDPARVRAPLARDAEAPATPPEARRSPTVPTEPLPPTRPWPDERPSSQWLSTAARDAMRARALWLEAEARALEDPTRRARGLLACSEMFAGIGELEQAQALAAEARDLSPSLALAHWQARALLPSAADGYPSALKAEIDAGAGEPARVHALLLCAEILAAAGDDAGAAEHLEEARRASPTDARPAVLLAARALGRGDLDSPALRSPAGGEGEAAGAAADRPSLVEAIAVCKRLRGVDPDPHAPPHDPTPSDVLLEGRRALDRGDVAGASRIAAKLSSIPGLANGAKWLAASLGATVAASRPDAYRLLREIAEGGDEEARRALAAQAIELADPDRLAEVLGPAGTFTSAERVTLAALAGRPLSASDAQLDATSATAGMAALAAAATAIAAPSVEDDRDGHRAARVERTVGSAPARALVGLGRLLAAAAPASDVEAALAELREQPRSADVRAVALEMAWRAGRASEVSEALEAWGKGWGSGEEAAVGPLAAALVAERAGDGARALEAFKAARTADPTNEAALRAIASLESVDLVAEMNQLADDLGAGQRAAMARVEAVARSEGALPEPTRAHMLEQAHEAAPTLPIAAFLAERIARRAGDVDEVLRWVRERRARATDPVEAALDGVREALLIADREPSLAAERLQEAHQARPHDVALRQLYERVASPPPESRAAWREQRAAEETGSARALLFLEAAYDYERAGDDESALRCAEAAGGGDATLGGIARERVELRGRRAARVAEEVLQSAKQPADEIERLEAYERLAALDANVRQDPASALLWHRSILERSPLHPASLRHIEHHLVGEGRLDELEPIAAGIARALEGTGAGECTAHAELATRLALRNEGARWDATFDLVELAAAEANPPLSAIRMLQAHARARGDDTAFVAATLELIERSSRSAETAVLLVRAAEAASRLDRVDQARTLLERACQEDAGDVVAWSLLADVRRRAGDPRGAAEACESLARCSLAREHQLRAWYEAGRLWESAASEEERAIGAFEAASLIDVTHEDLFDRLSHLYAVRKMQPELAALLERRLSGITDPEERLAMEVRRGRVLLLAGDVTGARRAFDAALEQRPDDAGALTAFVDLCDSQGDWEASEQALVRLARLVPSAEEQRDVYARLGELYSHRLVNLSRAELALKEVRKRAPGDLEVLEKLVDVYKRQNDAANAAELQQELVGKARSPEEKRKRVVELAEIHEQIGHDNRRAEQVLEAARREFPQDVGVLRALADFYIRHHQTPAVNILLDRVGGDARRALAAGRVSPALFDVLATVFELRGKTDAAQVTRCVLAALDGRPADMRGAGERALDPKLDELLAPEALAPSLRTLLAKAGDALDVAAAVDLRGLKATPLPVDSPLVRLATRFGQALGLSGVQVLVSPKLGAVAVPAAASPPTVVVGEPLVNDETYEGVGAFVVARSLKLAQAKACALARSTPADVAVLVSGWFQCFNPQWEPQGVSPAAVEPVLGRIRAALTMAPESDVAIVALEAAAATQAPTLVGAQVLAWANRVALLALGDTNAALDAVAASAGRPGAPIDPKERAAWIARTAEARDLVAFAVTDAFAEARSRVRG